MTDPDDFLPMSGIRYFTFCRRKWALIYLEQKREEKRARRPGDYPELPTGKRGEKFIVHDLRVVSHRLRLLGDCDAVEFRTTPLGVPVSLCGGLRLPTPVACRRSRETISGADRLLLCAQGMALEEMFACEVPQGAVYIERTRRREVVPFTPELRRETQRAADEMNDCFSRGIMPVAKLSRRCSACQLRDACLPALSRHHDTAAYLRRYINEEILSCENF